ncbi:related to GTPase activating protein sec2 [Melanopsichium pennsylvanicum]|uniref:Related to GTPase activating protein sec2 n=2 Tax=Melanopsichium pennsylvanicum TaxID=63383 RepID=A0AAJ5C2T3_9BASI|nr:related to GTPase activating protein sec2 [Melanopsichium pennsylvanicum 4]SNX81886.1 related to GTPase activating protein sec2 [Melanopsichium pennsylvanicum]
MSAATEAEPGKAEASEATVTESQLQRMDPDSILADEANSDDVLGQDSSTDAPEKRTTSLDQGQTDEASALKRASAASAIFSNAHNSPRQETMSIPSENGASHTQATQITSTETLQAQVKDLTNQVTGLNEKLVKSFNRIADLEDDYSDAQDRIRNMSVKIKELEKERSEHLDALNTGLLVEKAHVSNEMQRMMDRVIEETAQRGKAESDKSKIEAELDELSSSLFSEANKMVAVERLSRARAEEKSRNMEERLKDTEGIMLEQQKVLADLQRQVEKLQGGTGPKRNGDDVASIASIESEAVSFHRLNTSSLARSISQRTAIQERRHKPAADLAAEARLIINIVPYQEFRSFISHLRKLRKQLAPFYNYPLTHPGARESHNGTPTPRTASPAPQQATGTVASASSLSSAAAAYSQGFGSAVVSSSPFAIAGVSRHRDYPTLPSNVETMVSLPSQLALPFIKRSQEEDVEPCLRLDFAPGLNWLSRRQANAAILDGNLVIEPIFSGSATIDEHLVRRENAHLPPAACAMCGTPVVNVPLPSGVAATALSGEQGGKNSLVPSSIATATSSWASSAASSFGSITGNSGSGSSSGTITPKPSRGGLFSSFRRSSSNTKTAEGEATAPASATPEAETQSVAPADGLVLAHLPVPTHIFRLSESAPTRYLLCPHHCLLRLRAACQYWGFVRNLERSVVLEGKFMNDEQHTAAASSSSLDLPKDIPAPKSEQVETLEKAVAAAEIEEASKVRDESAQVAEEGDAAAAEKTEAANMDGENTGTDTVEDQKTEAEKIKESVQEESGETAASEADQPSSEEKKQHSAKETSEAEGKAPADDDDFADAPSSPTEAESKPVDKQGKVDDVKAEDETKVEETTKDAEGVESFTTGLSSDAPADAKESTIPTATDAKPLEGTAETTTIVTAAAPPLPPRAAARGSGSASPAPALPPRRHPRAGAIAASAQPTDNVPPAVPARTSSPPPTALYLNKLDTMEWEDKMWTEVTKLKEELWRARIGLITEDGA